MPTKKEIREWLKQQGHNEEWFSKQLNFTDVDKWFMSDEENPPQRWEKQVAMFHFYSLFHYDTFLECTRKVTSRNG